MAQRKYAVKNVLAPDDLDEFTLVRKEIDAVLARAALCVVPCVRFSMVVLLVLVFVGLVAFFIVGSCCSHRGSRRCC